MREEKIGNLISFQLCAIFHHYRRMFAGGILWKCQEKRVDSNHREKDDSPIFGARFNSLNKHESSTVKEKREREKFHILFMTIWRGLKSSFHPVRFFATHSRYIPVASLVVKFTKCYFSPFRFFCQTLKLSFSYFVVWFFFSVRPYAHISAERNSILTEITPCFTKARGSSRRFLLNFIPPLSLGFFILYNSTVCCCCA